MVSIFNTVYCSILTVDCAIGTLASAFICAVNFQDWAKGRSLNPSDRFLVAIGTVNIFIRCSLMAKTYISMMGIDSRMFQYVFPAIFQLLVWKNIASIGLTASLCVFYCAKIVDFSHPLWVCVKLRVTKAVPWLLLGSIGGSLILSIPSYWCSFRDYLPNTTRDLPLNSTVPANDLDAPVYGAAITVLGFCVPLLVAMACITLILISLGRHTRRMKENMSEFSPPRLEAHHRAARMVGLLLLIYIPLFVAVSVRTVHPSRRLKLIMWLLFAISGTAQTFILILGNTKLQIALRKTVSPLRKSRAQRRKTSADTKPPHVMF